MLNSSLILAQLYNTRGYLKGSGLSPGFKIKNPKLYIYLLLTFNIKLSNHSFIASVEAPTTFHGLLLKPHFFFSLKPF